MILSRIKRIIGLFDNSKDDVLTDFILMYESAIKLKADVEIIPISLEWILIEAVISRYQRIGSEGMKSESVDIVTMQFHDEILAQYDAYFDDYKRKNNGSSSELVRVKFL